MLQEVKVNITATILMLRIFQTRQMINLKKNLDSCTKSTKVADKLEWKQ